MRCSEIEELLSAYANGELARTQREFVEEHIATCADCRARLEDYVDVRDKLISLRETPTLETIRNSTMSAIKTIHTRKIFSGWLRPALVTIPVVAILIALSLLQPWNSPLSPQAVLAQARDAIASLQSYRISIEGTNKDPDQEAFAIKAEIEFTAPDRLHIKQAGDADMEQIFIGDKQYFRNSPPSIGARMTANAYSSMLSREYTLTLLNSLKDIKELTDETIDRTTCLHYRGTFDQEKQMIEIWRSREERGLTISDEVKEEMLAEARSRRGPEIELWIGKDDSLVRQIKWDFSAEGGEVNLNFRFYDFNQPVTVEPPLDSQGNLLPGWTSPTPESPRFSTNVQSEVDNYDPTNRKVKFSVLITNISEETLTDVNVCIISVFPSPDSNPDLKIWFSWDNGQSAKGPYTVEPGQSLKYGSTFGYDATSISPETIAETIEKSYIDVSYTAPDGQLQKEIFNFTPPDSIYTLSSELPSNMIPVDLSPAGEYRLEEEGATSAGSRVTGEVNGKEYLFLEVNTQNSETPAPPGILVLDIRDRTAPHKVAYISSPDIWFFKSVALSGTVLYASTDSFLWVLDVSDPVSPKELTRLPDLTPNQMVISGDYAFINQGNNYIATLDISDPAHPENIGSMPLSSLSGFGLHLYGDYLFTEINNIFYTIDASEPSSLKIVNEYSFEDYHVGTIDLVDNRAFVALNTGISILDISDPENPRQIGFLYLKDQTVSGSLFVSEDRAYIFTRKSSGPDTRKTRLVFLDTSDPTNLAELGYWVMPDFRTFFDYSYSSGSRSYDLIDDYLYWYIGNPPNKAVIEIFDLSGPIK